MNMSIAATLWRLSLLLWATIPAQAGTICWVSDQLPVNSGTSDNNGGTVGRFTSGTGPYADEGFISLLTGAGHTVTRYNPPDTPTVLSNADVAQLNTFDLVVLTRALNSSALDSAVEAEAWNVRITKPLMCTNVFLVRRIRLGWFTGTTGNGELGGNVYSSALVFPDISNPASAWLTQGTDMTGDTTTESLYHQITSFTNPDRGQNFMTNAHLPLPGATVLATAAINGGYAAVSIPAGSTAVALGTTNQVLGGYRMLFTAGNQEPGTAPENVIGNAGFDNLTPTGEVMFLRAVALAMNSGVVPGPPLPELAIGRNGNAITLTWNDPLWQVEASDSMTAASWLPVAGPSPLTVPIDRNARFFRLFR